MSDDIVEFPDRRAIDAEAAEWLIRLDGDSPPSAEERAVFKAWLERGEVHRKALIDLARLWGRMNVLTALRVPLGEVPRRRRIRRGVWRVALASTATTAALALALVVVDRVLRSPDALLETNGLYATAIGQRQEVTLADGSLVHLNTNSQMRVAYSGAVREIRLLQGEAYFTVAKREAHPFRVLAGNRRVEAIGTAFAVHLSESSVNVTVTEGRVKLSTSTSGQSAFAEPMVPEPGVLEAGYRAVITGTGESSTVSVDTSGAADRLAWRDGVLLFTGEPLEEVVKEISRYTTMHIEIADASIRYLPVGGRFPIGETEAMLYALELNFSLNIEQQAPNRVLIGAADE